MSSDSKDLSSAPRVLIVDDTPENLAVLGGLLQTRYQVMVAISGQRALAIAARRPQPDLILLDVMMPEMDGYMVMERLQQDPATRGIPVIFVTALDSDKDEEKGLALGAVDYIAKPIRPAIVQARVKAHLELKQARDKLHDHNAWLESEVERRLEENQLMQDVSIRALANLAEVRDVETGNHIRRTQAYVEILAQQLSSQAGFSHYLTPRMIGLVTKAAPLHDIGKVGIPDHILLKPGRLEAGEFDVMKRHSQIGGDAIEAAMRAEVDQSTFQALLKHGHLHGPETQQALAAFEHTSLSILAVAREIAMWHHEKWDGSGYPHGRAGEDIPIPARIMAVADVFDALASDRVYRKAMPAQQAFEIIQQGSGSHFDPAVAESFLAQRDVVMEILRQHADREKQLAERRAELTGFGAA